MNERTSERAAVDGRTNRRTKENETKDNLQIQLTRQLYVFTFVLSVIYRNSYSIRATEPSLFIFIQPTPKDINDQQQYVY